MRVPFEWLKEVVPISVSAEEAAHRLTMLGLEVEALERVDSDTVFEINITPNRPDCLSIIGIARELSAAYGIPLEFPEHDVVAEAGELDFNVDILEPALCHRYAGRIVRHLKVGPSPEWLKKRLEKCGIRSINNVVDVTNYVLLELGHPLHAFDLHTLRGHRIRIGTPGGTLGSHASARLTTLDGVERDIPEDTLLIWDAERPVAVAGVMGGAETEVSSDTVDIFIESAYFDPVSVRKASKTLGLKTEASYRFERGADIKMLKKALDRAAFLMQEVARGEIYGKIDIYPKKYVPAEIRTSSDKINRVLGLRLQKSEIIGLLSPLGFSVEETGEVFTIKPPAYRMDVRRDADIIEEVVRTYGYDRIPATLPKALVGLTDREDLKKVYHEKFLSELKASFLKSGYTEVINYSFMAPQDLDLLQIGEGDERRKTVFVRNPLRAEDSCMRTTLIPALLRNVVHNVAHGNREFRLFEIAKIFIAEQADALPVEKRRLAAVYYKEKTKALYPEPAADFYVVKGIIEAILKDLKISGYSFARSSEPFLHPGQSADIMIGNDRIGSVGALSPLVTERLEAKVPKLSLFVIDLDLDRLVPYTMQELKYRPLPRYPFIERDTAIIIDASLEAAQIVTWLKAYPTELIEDIWLFDVYQGKNIPEGKKSIAFTVRYRATDRTLTDEEIDPVHQTLVAYILDKTKGELRS